AARGRLRERPRGARRTDLRARPAVVVVRITWDRAGLHRDDQARLPGRARMALCDRASSDRGGLRAPDLVVAAPAPRPRARAAGPVDAPAPAPLRARSLERPLLRGPLPDGADHLGVAERQPGSGDVAGGVGRLLPDLA